MFWVDGWGWFGLGLFFVSPFFCSSVDAVLYVLFYGGLVFVLSSFIVLFEFCLWGGVRVCLLRRNIPLGVLSHKDWSENCSCE